MENRVFGLENEYGLIYSPKGRRDYPGERILNYLFEGLISNSWSSNTFLANGARLYQDTGCHPEYSTPECDNPIDLIIHDKAGERILEALLISAEERLREEGLEGDIYIFKNNTDSIGNTYGCHENYLIDRDIDFWRLTEPLIPFLVTRQIYTGSGKVLKIANDYHYCMSQRAQHIHQKFSATTTSSRAIINTKDEPHADAEKYRRLHVIIGDSSMSEYTTYLKVGTSILVLRMIEDGFRIKEMNLDDPVKALKEISLDTACRKKVRLEDGREYTAVEIQREYLERALDYYQDKETDPVVEDIFQKWAYVLDKIEEDPMCLSREIDWVIKKGLIDSYLEKKNSKLGDPRVMMIDLQYHDIKQDRGFYYLLNKESMLERIVTEEEIQKAVSYPPQNTRAKIRGDFIRLATKHRKSYSVNWSYLKLISNEQRTIILEDPFQSWDYRMEEILASLQC